MVIRIGGKNYKKMFLTINNEITASEDNYFICTKTANKR